MNKEQKQFLDTIEQYKKMLYKIANSYCKEERDRQDLIQEMIMQLWLSFDKYDEQFKFSTWMYRIALNTAISFYRKTKIHQQKTTELTALITATLEAETTPPKNSNLALLQAFIQELKELDKALILMYLEGLSQKEISEIIGITPTNIGTKIARIKKQLRRKFQELKE
ncbi:MAG: RNA polymerase sigma factor [Bacteroidota bacterium]